MKENKSLIPAQVRDYLYPVALAVIGVLAIYGLVAEDAVPAWTVLAMALFGVGGTGVATAYRPGRHPESAPDVNGEPHV